MPALQNLLLRKRLGIALACKINLFILHQLVGKPPDIIRRIVVIKNHHRSVTVFLHKLHDLLFLLIQEKDPPRFQGKTIYKKNRQYESADQKPPCPSGVPCLSGICPGLPIACPVFNIRCKSQKQPPHAIDEEKNQNPVNRKLIPVGGFPQKQRCLGNGKKIPRTGKKKQPD